MAIKFLDNNGLLYFWQKIVNEFAKKSELTTASTTTPKMNGSANVGSENSFARGDHVHPSDSTKVDKVDGKGLSTNDFTTEEKTKLSNIESGANNYILPVASASALGGIKVGTRLSITDGVLSADEQEGTTDYEDLSNKPSINGVTLSGNKSLSSLGIDLSAKENVSNKVTDISSGSTDTQYPSAKAVYTLSEQLRLVAEGKCKSYVFATVTALDTELAKSSFTSTLNVGDVFLITATDVPDYWWTGSAKSPLETTKVDLQSITNAEIDSIVAT